MEILKITSKSNPNPFVPDKASPDIFNITLLYSIFAIVIPPGIYVVFSLKKENTKVFS